MKHGHRLTGVVTQAKTGRLAYLGEYLIDATGDGDLAALAGVPFVLGVGPEDAVYKQGLSEKEMDDLPPRDAWYFNIPYRCLVAYGLQNLLLAGRLISSTREAAGCTRPTIPCMISGEAAGTAAALCKKAMFRLSGMSTSRRCGRNSISRG